MTTYQIINEDTGYAITDGVQAHEVKRMAQRIANEKRVTVSYRESGSDDEGTYVSPARSRRSNA